MTAYDRPTIGRFYPTIGMLSPLLSPLRSVCNRLRPACVLPPYNPRAVAAPPWALGAQRCSTRKEGKESGKGSDRPRHPLARVERPKRPIINRSAIQHPRRRWQDQLSTSFRATVGLGSNENRSHTLPSVCPACCGQHRRVAFSTLCSSEKSARPMLRSHRKGFSRALLRHLQHSLSERRAQGNDRRNP
jgi:hypothetical protein